jgi:Spy/CpxP family protein refolding chaperone
MVTRVLSRFALPIAFVLAAPALGCSGSATTSEPPATAETATTRAPVAQSSHGAVKLAGDALGDVPLTASQRVAIEQLATDAEGRHAAARAAHQDLAAALASQVQAGQIDRTALQPKIDAVVAAMRAAQPADRAALEQLHAILTPDQRAAFVDALESRIHQRMGEMKATHPLKQWAEDLQLSDDQKAQIHAALGQRLQALRQAHAVAGTDEHPWGEAREHGKKVLDAFKQDRFVMDEVAPAQDISQKAAKMTDHLLGMVETVLPLLTPDQRAIASQKIRDHGAASDDVTSPMP